MFIRSDHRPLVVGGFVTDEDDREPTETAADLLAEVGLPPHAVREVLAEYAVAGPGPGAE